MESDRLDTIESVVSIINTLCIKSKIELKARQLKNGKLAVVIHDKTTDKDYLMSTKRGG